MPNPKKKLTLHGTQVKAIAENLPEAEYTKEEEQKIAITASSFYYWRYYRNLVHKEEIKEKWKKENRKPGIERTWMSETKDWGVAELELQIQSGINKIPNNSHGMGLKDCHVR